MKRNNIYLKLILSNILIISFIFTGNLIQDNFHTQLHSNTEPLMYATDGFFISFFVLYPYYFLSIILSPLHKFRKVNSKYVSVISFIISCLLLTLFFYYLIDDIFLIKGYYSEIFGSWAVKSTSQPVTSILTLYVLTIFVEVFKLYSKLTAWENN